MSAPRGNRTPTLVVQLLGVVAGQPGVAGDGVAVDADQPGRLAGAGPPGDVFEDGGDGVGRQAGVEQRGGLPLGEASMAGGAAGQAGAKWGPYRMGTVRLPCPRLPWSEQSGFSQQNRLRSSMASPPPNKMPVVTRNTLPHPPCRVPLSQDTTECSVRQGGVALFGTRDNGTGVQRLRASSGAFHHCLWSFMPTEA